jgi:hypothetical protein
MNAPPRSGSDQKERFTTLIVTPRAREMASLEAVIGSLGLRGLTAGDFHVANRLLAYRPHLLITELQLDEYNGLNLVLHARVVRPRLAAVVTSRWDDSVLQRDAESIGATFVEIPTRREELIAAILRTVTDPGRARVASIRPPFERRRWARRAGVRRLMEMERRLAVRRRDVTAVFEEAAERTLD